ncbi:MAG: tetratricopeptide repeat protein [Bacteroidales bacterium]|jgi:tetratricopeptide (TPR) repeat protein|nr:tetratricopeptide repeat protein [Bacteroidales bacterium]
MRKIHIFAVASAILVTAGCAGPNKMLKNADQVRYQVIPNPMEMRADSVAVTIKGSYPAKFFPKKATVHVTPTIQWDGGSVALPAKDLRGESVQSNAQMISYTTGGSFSYKAQVPYTDAMFQSSLMVGATAKVGNKSVDFPAVKVADGVMATANLLQDDAQVINVDNQLKRNQVVTSETTIMFLIDQANVRSSEMGTAGIKALKDFTASVAKDTTLIYKGIDIHGYASPDGPQDLNQRLASQRETNAGNAIKRALNKSGFVGTYTKEDWDKFVILVQNSNIQDKEVILQILSSYSDPDVREAELRKMSVIFKELAEQILPQLRRSEVVVSANKKDKPESVILAAALGQSNVQLTLQEYLYAAETLAQSTNDKITILKNATVKFPQEWSAFNNLGAAYIAASDYANALTALNKANEISEGDNVVKNNLGVLAVKQGNIAQGLEYFELAQGAGPEVRYNLGWAQFKAGNYDQAVAMFANAPRFNTALAQVLTGDNDSAMQTLTRAESSAVASYLKAVIGAREKNLDQVTTNLQAAVNADPTLLQRAKKDIEFRAFAQDASFKAIVQ